LGEAEKKLLKGNVMEGKMAAGRPIKRKHPEGEVGGGGRNPDYG